MVLIFLQSGLILFSSYHKFHHGDSLLPALMSTQKVTFFYWEQNRYGALVPIIYSFLKNPYYNLLLQSFVHIYCGIAVFFIFPLVAGDEKNFFYIGIISSSVFICFSKLFNVFEFFSTAQPYGVSLTLFLLAYLLFMKIKTKSYFIGLSLSFIFMFFAFR